MRFCAALLGVTLSVSSALAQDTTRSDTRPATVTLSDIEAAQLLVANNRLDDAKRLLARILAATPEDNEAQFLLATIAVAQKDYDTAI